MKAGKAGSCCGTHHRFYFKQLKVLSLKQIVFTLFLHSLKNGNDSVAQLVEQYTFNVWVLGSSPSRITKNVSGMRRFFIFCLFSFNAIFLH